MKAAPSPFRAQPSHKEEFEFVEPQDLCQSFQAQRHVALNQTTRRQDDKGRYVMTKVDVAIVGAGIMGLAHAIHAARAGLSVAVFDRSAEANGASVRNFGMLAVVAQAPGAQLASARRALGLWQEIALQAGISMHRAGCLFLARASQEMQVLEECAALNKDNGHALELLTKSKLPDYADNLNHDALLGGLWSPDAWKVDQRQASSRIADWLRREHGVTFHFNVSVHGVTSGTVETSAGTFRAGHTIMCGGDEFGTLLPDAFRASGVTRCQLQMLRTPVQPEGWRLKPFILGGLSMTRYSLFASCPSLAALKAYQEAYYAEHLKHGIHVIACQEADGSITIGDSHAYGDAADAAPSNEIDRLIMSDLAGMITLPDATIADRWIGRYAHLLGTDALTLAPELGVCAVTMTNGQGMTHAFAVAEGVIRDLAG